MPELTPSEGYWPAQVLDYGLATDSKDREYAFIDLNVEFTGGDSDNPENFFETFRWQGWLHTEGGRKVTFGALAAAGLRSVEDFPKMADGINGGALNPAAKITAKIGADSYRGAGHFKVEFINDATLPPPLSKLNKTEATARLMNSGAMGELGAFLHDLKEKRPKPEAKPKLKTEDIDL